MTHKLKPITDLPTKPGTYNILVEGVMTFLPLYAKFDGSQWDTSKIQGYLHMGKEISYFDNEPTP